jgi:hypothetical protein
MAKLFTFLHTSGNGKKTWYFILFFLHPYIIYSCNRCVIPMNIKVVCLFTSSPMELITFNVVKCLQLTSLLWTWSCTSLLLLLILWLGTKFDGHGMKICWMWWLVSKIGVASFLSKAIDYTHVHIQKQIQSLQHAIVSNCWSW